MICHMPCLFQVSTFLLCLKRRCAPAGARYRPQVTRFQRQKEEKKKGKKRRKEKKEKEEKEKEEGKGER